MAQVGVVTAGRRKRLIGVLLALDIDNRTSQYRIVVQNRTVKPASSQEFGNILVGKNNALVFARFHLLTERGVSTIGLFVGFCPRIFGGSSGVLLHSCQTIRIIREVNIGLVIHARTVFGER